MIACCTAGYNSMLHVAPTPGGHDVRCKTLARERRPAACSLGHLAEERVEAREGLAAAARKLASTRRALGNAEAEAHAAVERMTGFLHDNAGAEYADLSIQQVGPSKREAACQTLHAAMLPRHSHTMPSAHTPDTIRQGSRALFWSFEMLRGDKVEA